MEFFPQSSEWKIQTKHSILCFLYVRHHILLTLNRDTRRQNHLPLLPCYFSFNITKGNYINLIWQVNECSLQFTDYSESWRNHQVSERGSKQWEETRFCTFMAISLILGALSHSGNGKRQCFRISESKQNQRTTKDKDSCYFLEKESFWNVQYLEKKSWIPHVKCPLYFLFSFREHGRNSINCCIGKLNNEPDMLGFESFVYSLVDNKCR